MAPTALTTTAWVLQNGALLAAMANALEALERLLLNVTALTTTAWVLQNGAPLAAMANA
jgi:hypothetical protein